MAWTGTAQIDVEGVCIKIIVKDENELEVAEFVDTLDESHIGGQARFAAYLHPWMKRLELFVEKHESDDILASDCCQSMTEYSSGYSATAQIKIDILERCELNEPIPDEMIQNPDTCTLVLVAETETRKIGNFDRLINFERYFDGRKVHLEILSPRTERPETEMDLTHLRVITRPDNELSLQTDTN